MFETDRPSSQDRDLRVRVAPVRILGAAVRSSETGERVGYLNEMALRGLETMLIGSDTFVHTMRRVDDTNQLRPEGQSLRYAAIVALGLSCVGEAEQRRALKGSKASYLAEITADRAATADDMGVIALAAWAAAEAGAVYASRLFKLLAIQLAADAPVETVSCAWALAAALAARQLGDTSALVQLAADRLLSGQTTSGLFPHFLPSGIQGWARAHVACFADQIYPIQALARLALATDSGRALRAAEACAARLCALQGKSGQWWWHYDTRDGSVVERYPVYSVHQHGMAPMALLELAEVGGNDRWWPSIIRGVAWLDHHPETSASLFSDDDALVWRKIGRAEPKKVVRSVSAITTRLKRGWHLPGLGRFFPPNHIDHECRPYEFGWLLYAWQSAGIAGTSLHVSGGLDG